MVQAPEEKTKRRRRKKSRAERRSESVREDDESTELDNSSDGSDTKHIRLPISDVHFFSDTESSSHLKSTSSTPVRSDSEIELAQRVPDVDDVMTSSASWKWGELPTTGENLSVAESTTNVMSFMKEMRHLHNVAKEGMYLSDLDVEGLDPEVEELYFPTISSFSHIENEDRESGNGTSLPHSPSSIESPKSLDSDFDEVKPAEK